VRVRSDAGFTLVELLLVITILGVITIPLGNVVIGMVRNHQATQDRLELSHDAQISAAYVARDVAGVGVRDYGAVPAAGATLPFKQSVQLGAAYDAGGYVCGGAATPTATVRFLADAWNASATPATVAVDVTAYYLAGAELHRMKCLAGSTTPASDIVVAHNVTSVAVACSTACQDAAVPQAVKLTLTLSKPTAPAYPIELTGQRRQT
jgi:prepilin-type N-terminal cleavage/methylation domain-containing protein